MAISMPNFSASSNNALDSEITILLSGVFASIYGIFLSLLWTYFEKRALSKIDDYFQNIETLFSSQIWTADELTIHRYSKGDLEDNRFLSALQETFYMSFIKNINAQQVDAFKAIMHESSQNFKYLADFAVHVSAESSEVQKSIRKYHQAVVQHTKK